MDIRERIRAYMEREKLTQGEFSERSGIPQSTISMIMRGADPRLSTVLKIEKTITGSPTLHRRVTDV